MIDRQCPHCGPDRVIGRLTHDLQDDGAYCNNCGWDSEHRPQVFDVAEAERDVIERAREMLRYVHRTDESFAVDAMWRSRATQLREEANRLEARDGAIHKLQWAIARLDALTKSDTSEVYE